MTALCPLNRVDICAAFDADYESALAVGGVFGCFFGRAHTAAAADGSETLPPIEIPRAKLKDRVRGGTRGPKVFEDIEHEGFGDA